VHEDACLKFVDSRRIRRSRRHIHTRADPFLFANAEHLYLFFEVEKVGGRGYISALRTRDLVSYEDCGIILQRTDHVSYPQVLRTAEGIFMVPESKDAGEVALYGFKPFPRGAYRRKRLVAGHYADPTLVEQDGRWWLFATGEDGLHLFSSANLLKDDFRPHPLNPVCTDARIARCAGNFLRHEGALYRPAQNSEVGDGSNVRMVRVLELTAERYREEEPGPSFFTTDRWWQRRGGHHVSHATFGGTQLVALDGRHSDTLLNTLLVNPLWRAASAIRRLAGNPLRGGTKQGPEAVAEWNPAAHPSL
jgi:hypothetical protein